MKAAVLGYGKSGKAAETLLRHAGAVQVDIYEDKNNAYPSISEFKNGYDRVAVSPGIDIIKRGLKIDNLTSEIELAYEALAGKGKIMVMTGTNGKSTVTYLTAQILENAGIKAVACGNIGVPFGEVVLKGGYDVFVLELSSFQIELLRNFKADMAAITNLAPDHLDRYPTYDAYIKAKMDVLKFVREDGFAVLPDEQELLRHAEYYKGRRVIINEALNGLPKLSGKVMDFGNYSLDTAKFPLFGTHNLLNLAFSLVSADSILNFAGDITPQIAELKGLPHRCEYSGTVNGISFINDSKATNVYSTLACLKGAKAGNVIILGGRDKNGDFGLLADELNRAASTVIAYGEAARIIKEKLKGLLTCDFITSSTMKEAVKTGLNVAHKGGNVILTPACSSYDSFNNFEERGERFMQIVKELGGK
ncbi:UDP-N-acetylmuramoyl-L-alanine--D-glutamate ligase [Geovibrio sp. ADMFC3]